MKDKIFGVLQRVGRSFMLPIAILPVAGLLLGIGGSFTNLNMLEAYGLLDAMGPGTVWNTIFSVMSAAGNIVFANLPLLFAMGVAIGMAKKEKAVAAMASVIAFLIMNTVISQLLQLAGKVVIDGNNVTYSKDVLAGTITSVLGIQSLQMGVFGGIIVGLGVAALHNKFYNIKLPQVLSFFGGTRFVPIISAMVYLVVGVIMYFLWPVIQNGIYSLGGAIQNSGYAGTFIYGLIERALIPFGLHHVFYLPFWQTAVGGTMTVAGQVVNGAQNIFFAQLADPSTTEFAVSATRFMSGKFPLMIFGLPGAALAMYTCAKSKKKKVVGGLLLSAALTSMITGITEPIEFTFLFVAPLLYVIHCIFAGAAYMFMHIFNVGVGMTFSGGLIDLTLFGVLQGNSKTHWIWVVIVGLFYFAAYFLIFRALIKKMDLKTPGRESDYEEPKLFTRADVNARKEGQQGGTTFSDPTSALILKGLGGKGNLSDVDCCATRLRVTVVDGTKIDKDILKASGAAGVIAKGNGIQVIYGPQVTVIKSNLEDFIASPESDHIDEIGKEEENTAQEQAEEIDPAEIEKAEDLVCALTGEIVPIEEVEDDVFSQKILGDGIAVEPTVGKVFAPCDCTVDNVFDTKHAIALSTEKGANILIHIGIDTVKLEGKYYDVKVSDGDKIKKGDLLVEFDIDGIKGEGYKVTTPIIICNTDDYSDIVKCASGKVKAGDKLLELR